MEILCACSDDLSPHVCSRTAADIERQGGGRRGSPCADLLRRYDGRPAQMRRATAKITCSRQSVVGTGHLREGRRALRLSCWQADLGIQMARLPARGTHHHRRADWEADRVPSVRTQPRKGYARSAGATQSHGLWPRAGAQTGAVHCLRTREFAHRRRTRRMPIIVLQFLFHPGQAPSGCDRRMQTRRKWPR